MAERHLLHESKVDDFAAWAHTQGYDREPTKGFYEKLRLRKRGEPPLIFLQRDRTRHLSIPDQPERALQLVRMWIFLMKNRARYQRRRDRRDAERAE